MHIKRNNKGFTLIEVMIAMMLFTTIMVIGMGAVLSANSTHRKTTTLRAVMDNLNFVMEDMARNLRLGSNYHCFTNDSVGTSGEEDPQDCTPGSYPGGSLILAFGGYADVPGINDQIVYAISANGSSYSIYKSFQGGVSGTFTPITPDEVQIDPLRSGFSVVGTANPNTGSAPDDKIQPMVIIRLAGTVRAGANIQTPFNLETTVSQRLIDR